MEMSFYILNKATNRNFSTAISQRRGASTICHNGHQRFFIQNSAGMPVLTD